MAAPEAAREPCTAQESPRPPRPLRALASESEVLLADEPTGNLDRRNSEAVIAAIVAAARSGRAVIVATHDMSFRDAADVVVDLAEVRDVART